MASHRRLLLSRRHVAVVGWSGHHGWRLLDWRCVSEEHEGRLRAHAAVAEVAGHREARAVVGEVVALIVRGEFGTLAECGDSGLLGHIMEAQSRAALVRADEDRVLAHAPLGGLPGHHLLLRPPARALLLLPPSTRQRAARALRTKWHCVDVAQQVVCRHGGRQLRFVPVHRRVLVPNVLLQMADGGVALVDAVASLTQLRLLLAALRARHVEHIREVILHVQQVLDGKL
mmetsp:Transcript_14698/g.30822  ORF Transcript_14698/g.30822 Transcript_14698/m.30822 type:complete len:230 (-) Transcript_14698:450-1139(-)